MATPTTISKYRFDWSVAFRPKPGQNACGDLHLVKTVGDIALLAVVDGLGHGSEAVSAAQRAVQVLEGHATEPLMMLMHRCHEALSSTRGVVMTLASVQMSDGTMAWMAVGNVEGWLFRAGNNGLAPSQQVLLRSGVVGYQLPALHAEVLALAPGDLLLFATDGIRADFTDQLKLAAPPADIVQQILQHCFKGHDDGLVLAARYPGKVHE